jgi:nitrite reductase/ring-hydroxylating ferredoxin subunit
MKPEPLWREEFSIESEEERYVARRQFSKFLVLTSLGMFAGNVWILMRSFFVRTPSYPETVVARGSDVPVKGVKLFSYPTPDDPCILVRTETGFVAYSQKCTHLSCSVYYSQGANRLECPCHEGYFSIGDGAVIQGPPPRRLPRVLLKHSGDDVVATGIES